MEDESLAELLVRMTQLCNQLRENFPLSEEELFEQRVRLIYGNLGLERPDLTIDQVRRVLRELEREREDTVTN